MAHRRRNRTNKSPRQAKNNKTKKEKEQLEKEELALRRDDVRFKRNQIRYANLCQMRKNFFIILQTVSLFLLGVLGVTLLVGLIVCAIWLPTYVQGVADAFQFLSGVASLIVGIWALTISLRAEKASSLSAKRQRAVNYSPVPQDTFAQFGEDDVKKDD